MGTICHYHLLFRTKNTCKMSFLGQVYLFSSLSSAGRYMSGTSSHLCPLRYVYMSGTSSHLCPLRQVYMSGTSSHLCPLRQVHVRYLFSSLSSQAGTCQVPLLISVLSGRYMSGTSSHLCPLRQVHVRYLFSSLSSQAGTCQVPLLISGTCK